MRSDRLIGAALVDKIGYRRTYTVCVFISLWWIATDELGHPPRTADEFAEHMHVHRTTAFRWQRDFREGLPQYSTPTELRAALNRPPSTKLDRDHLAYNVMQVALP